MALQSSLDRNGNLYPDHPICALRLLDINHGDRFDYLGLDEYARGDAEPVRREGVTVIGPSAFMPRAP